jgi:hypothetical protein
LNVFVLYEKVNAEFRFGACVSLGCRTFVSAAIFKMVVRYLSCETYVYGKRFALPREGSNGSVRGYEIFREDGLVKFFCGDRGERGDLNRWEIPAGAREMEFLEMKFYDESHVGAPAFYDNKGNLLKIGNR